ncbi:MAG: OmpA family protein [Pseudomonadota bacterium]
MKPSTIIFFTVLIMAAGISCGPSQEEYDALSNKYSRLQKEYDELKLLRETEMEKISELMAENTALRSKLNKLGIELGELDSELADAKAINEELKKKQEMAKKRLETLKNMLSKFKSLIAAGKLKVKIRDGKMFLELPSAILFPSGKSALSEEGQATLTEVAAVLVEIPDREFLVAGHTDNVPIKSAKYPSNWELSTARAVAVVKFMQEMGVSPVSLSAAGYSEYQPIGDNSSEDGKAQNRRIEITLMPNLNELPDLSDLEKELD